MKRGRVRLAVTFTDGQRIQIDRDTSRAIESPQTSDEVAAKYRVLTEGLIDGARQEAIEEMVRSIEDLPDVRELLALLAPPVAAAFD